MTAVFIHGVMDTFRTWDRVRDHLTREDVVTLRLPGFDSDLPDGFDGTKEAHVDFLVGEIAKLDGPVDLVGHDFGCLFAARIASTRPDLIRTWTCISGPVDPEYEWHAWAKIWQTEGEGERWMADLDPTEFEQGLIADRLPPEDAKSAVSFIDERMKGSVLKLYRSAVELGREWAPDLPNATSPGLVMWGLEDPYLPHRFADKLAEATGAEMVVKVRAGHWPIVEHPDVVARELEAHWAKAR